QYIALQTVRHAVESGVASNEGKHPRPLTETDSGESVGITSARCDLGARLEHHHGIHGQFPLFDVELELKATCQQTLDHKFHLIPAGLCRSIGPSARIVFR